MRLGMIIDLARCVGCYSCTIACKQANFLPPGIFWNRVLIAETGKYPTVTKIIYPLLCNHCKDAACIRVCPTGATTQREDGIVLIDQDKCVGCRYCLIACPYQQRSFYPTRDRGRGYFSGQGFTPYEELGKQINPINTGVVVKCTLCVDRVDEGIKRGFKPGIDRDATPVCVKACPAKARYFGDLDDPYSEVSRLIRVKKGVQLHPEFGTDPSVYYLIY